jgi:N-acetylglucosaminyl-diphospho-decaprenol L-rhamnosyltransferase
MRAPAASTQPVLLDIGAVIVTHRRAELARACTQRVLLEVDARSIVVVVNDPENAPKDELEWLKANVGFLVLNETPRGYGTNVNEGVRRLGDRCRCYLLLNDDVVPEPGMIGVLKEALDSDPTVALAGPRLVDADGRRQQVVYRLPTLGSELASALIVPARVQRWLWRRFVLGGIGTSEQSRVWLVGAALMVRASAFEAIGGFDEQFFLYSEETDLCFRMRERGWTARACEGAVAVHLGAESTADRRFRRLIGVSRRKYIRKHWSRRERAALGALLQLTYAWNAVYVLGRILLEPWSFREKLSFWVTHWDKRPHSDRRFRAPGWSGDA